MQNKLSILGTVILSFILLVGCEKDENGRLEEEFYDSWEVVDFLSIESMLYMKDNDYNPVITFKEDDSYTIKLDANSCMGTIETNGDSVQFSAAGCTKMCCDSDFSKKFLLMLPQVRSYTFAEGDLRLEVPGWGWINLKSH